MEPTWYFVTKFTDVAEIEEHLLRSHLHFIVLITEDPQCSTSSYFSSEATRRIDFPPLSDEQAQAQLDIWKLGETIYLWVHPFQARDVVVENAPSIKVPEHIRYAQFTIKGKSADSTELAVAVVHNAQYKDGDLPQSLMQHMNRQVARCGVRVITGLFGVRAKEAVERLCGTIPTATSSPFYNTFSDPNGEAVAWPQYTICFGKAKNCSWPEEAKRWKTHVAIERDIAPLFRLEEECIPQWRKWTPSQADLADCCDTEWGNLKTKSLLADLVVPGVHPVVVWAGTSTSGHAGRRKHAQKKINEWRDKQKEKKRSFDASVGKPSGKQSGKSSGKSSGKAYGKESSKQSKGKAGKGKDSKHGKDKATRSTNRGGGSSFASKSTAGAQLSERSADAVWTQDHRNITAACSKSAPTPHPKGSIQKALQRRKTLPDIS